MIPCSRSSKSILTAKERVLHDKTRPKRKTTAPDHHSMPCDEPWSVRATVDVADDHALQIFPPHCQAKRNTAFVHTFYVIGQPCDCAAGVPYTCRENEKAERLECQVISFPLGVLQSCFYAPRSLNIDSKVKPMLSVTCKHDLHFIHVCNCHQCGQSVNPITTRSVKRNAPNVICPASEANVVVQSFQDIRVRGYVQSRIS